MGLGETSELVPLFFYVPFRGVDLMMHMHMPGDLKMEMYRNSV